MAAIVAAPAPAAPASAAAPLGACLRPLDGLPPPDLSLPALEPVKNRETYRQRPESELEEATWFSAEAEDTLVEPTAIRLRSIHSKQATIITFSNKSPFRVRTLWIDFAGNEVVYSVLEPNSTRRYHTYQTHPWIVRELHSGTRMMLSGRPAVVGLAAEQTVEIAAPPQLKWSLDTFTCFPEAYKSSVKTLLLAHKHLEEYAQHNLTHLAPLKLGAAPSPCSPTAVDVPCSPRATLTQLGALPTSPKARRLTVSPVPPSPCTPRRAAAVADSSPAGSAGSGGGPSSAATTTSISITNEASHFKATLTVSSPTRALLKQSINIQVFNNPAATVTFGSSMMTQQHDSGAVADQATSVVCEAESGCGAGSSSGRYAARRPSSAPGGRRSSSSRSKGGLFNNLVHTFKHAFKPSLRHVRDSNDSCNDSLAAPPQTTTHITLRCLSQMLGAAAGAGASDPMEVDAADDNEPQQASCAAPWPPAGTHLGHLPSHLLATIAELAAPVAWQTMAHTPKGRPDIQPTLLACPPKTAEEEAAELLQQQQQDADAADDADGIDDLPALI